jgi:lipoprotein NlpI
MIEFDLDQLRQHVTANRFDEWVRTISKYYLGIDKMTEQSVFAEARKGKDDSEVSKRLCESFYYLGVKHLAAGMRKEAMDYFTKNWASTTFSFTSITWSRSWLLFHMSDAGVYSHSSRF